MMRPQSNSIFWVIATLAIAMTPQVPRMSALVAVMSLAPLVWRLAAELNDWKPLKSLVRYAATAMSLIALVVSTGGLFGRRASVSLLAAMLALKLLECERIRDARLIVARRVLAWRPIAEPARILTDRVPGEPREPGARIADDLGPVVTDGPATPDGPVAGQEVEEVEVSSRAGQRLARIWEGYGQRR